MPFRFIIETFFRWRRFRWPLQRADSSVRSRKRTLVDASRPLNPRMKGDPMLPGIRRPKPGRSFDYREASLGRPRRPPPSTSPAGTTWSNPAVRGRQSNHMMKHRRGSSQANRSWTRHDERAANDGKATSTCRLRRQFTRTAPRPGFRQLPPPKQGAQNNMTVYGDHQTFRLVHRAARGMPDKRLKSADHRQQVLSLPGHAGPGQEKPSETEPSWRAGPNSSKLDQDADFQRYRQFSARSGVSRGDVVTPYSIAPSLCHELGSRRACGQSSKPNHHSRG